MGGLLGYYKKGGEKMNQVSKKIVVSFRIEPLVWKKLKREAERLGTTRSNLLRNVAHAILEDGSLAEIMAGGRYE